MCIGGESGGGRGTDGWRHCSKQNDVSLTCGIFRRKLPESSPSPVRPLSSGASFTILSCSLEYVSRPEFRVFWGGFCCFSIFGFVLDSIRIDPIRFEGFITYEACSCLERLANRMRQEKRQMNSGGPGTCVLGVKLERLCRCRGIESRASQGRKDVYVYGRWYPGGV